MKEDGTVAYDKGVIGTESVYIHVKAGADGSDEFYDLEIDPNEWFNLTEEPEIKAIKDLLISELPKNDAPDARGGNSPGN